MEMILKSINPQTPEWLPIANFVWFNLLELKEE